MKSQKIIYLFMGFLIFLSGCGKEPTKIFATSIKSVTPTIQSGFPKVISTPTVSDIVIIPTIIEYSEELAKSRVMKFLENNGDCTLPCWWGLVPGKSGFAQVSELIGTISDQTYTWDDERRNVTIISASIPYGYKNDPQNEIFFSSINFYFQKGTLFILESSLYYQLTVQQFLAEFGNPNEIWVRTYSHVIEAESSWELSSWPFEIALFYKSKGIAIILYDGDAREENGGKITACPNEWIEDVAVFEPDTFIEFEDFLQYSEYFYENGWAYIPLLDATGLQIGEFVDMMKLDQNLCISTSKNLWPDP